MFKRRPAQLKIVGLDGKGPAGRQAGRTLSRGLPQRVPGSAAIAFHGTAVNRPGGGRRTSSRLAPRPPRQRTCVTPVGFRTLVETK